MRDVRFEKVNNSLASFRLLSRFLCSFYPGFEFSLPLLQKISNPCLTLHLSYARRGAASEKTENDKRREGNKKKKGG